MKFKLNMVLIRLFSHGVLSVTAFEPLLIRVNVMDDKMHRMCAVHTQCELVTVHKLNVQISATSFAFNFCIHSFFITTNYVIRALK